MLNPIPLVSVVIPNFNYGRFLNQCIDSILAQDYQNLELIVVDDGSTDNSRDIARSYGDKIILIEQSNLGVNAARNQGAIAAKGDYVAYCDSDDFWRVDKISRQMSIFESRPNLALVFCGIQETDARGNFIVVKEPVFSGYLANKYIQNPSIAIVPNAPSTALIKRSLIFKIGMWDESIRGNAEDWDFFRRLSLVGEFAFEKEPATFVRVHDSNRSNLEIQQSYLDNLRVMKKALEDDNHLWTKKKIRYFVRKFESQYLKNCLKRGSLRAAAIHLNRIVRGSYD